jgi:hypothetical protein
MSHDCETSIMKDAAKGRRHPCAYVEELRTWADEPSAIVKYESLDSFR